MDLQDIAKQISEARKVRKLSHEQLAILTGLSVQEIIALESGNFDPQVSILITIATQLNYTFRLGNVSI